jgi:phosphoglycerol transferase MdoB-like AlkP superfamily enzyme
VPAALGLGALLGLAAAGLGWWRARGGTAGRALSGSWEALLGLAIGLIGTTLAGLSLFTDHTVTYGNRNLFLAGPLHLAVVSLAVATAAGARSAGRWLAWLWSLLAALGLLSLALQVFPALRQDSGLIAALLLPTELGCAAAGWLGRITERA